MNPIVIQSYMGTEEADLIAKVTEDSVNEKVH